MTIQPIQVAAAVIHGPDQKILLAQRPEGKPYAGWWEFPGGKIERGETPLQALLRELEEELGIIAVDTTPWLHRQFVYTHATVALHFFHVWRWQGEPVGREGQSFAWQTPGNWTVSPMLPANQAILGALELPTLYGISCAEELGIPFFLERADQAVRNGLRAIQIRDKSLPLSKRVELACQLQERISHTSDVPILLFWHGDESLARELGLAGVHWDSQQLLGAKQRPADLWVGASCHNPQELAYAAALGLDYALLGSVKKTASHPGAPSLGWDKFATWICQSPIPVYALGGLECSDVPQALALGAQGVAMRSAIWS